MCLYCQHGKALFEHGVVVTIGHQDIVGGPCIEIGDFGGFGISYCPMCGKKLETDDINDTPQTPCELCMYNPPSSRDGKPCSVCPASAVYRDGEAEP